MTVFVSTDLVFYFVLVSCKNTHDPRYLNNDPFLYFIKTRAASSICAG